MKEYKLKFPKFQDGAKVLDVKSFQEYEPVIPNLKYLIITKKKHPKKYNIKFKG